MICFTSTIVQILTVAEEQERARVEAEAAAAKAQTAAELKEAEERRARAGMFIQQMPTYAYAGVRSAEAVRAEGARRCMYIRMLTYASSVC